MTEMINNLDSLYFAACRRLADPATVDFVGPELRDFVDGIVKFSANGGPAIDYVKERIARPDANVEVWEYFLSKVKWPDLEKFIALNLEEHAQDIREREYWSSLLAECES